MSAQERAAGLIRDVVAAMGLTLDVKVLDTPEAIRLEISGDGGEVLLKRKGEALDALQQIVNTGFRRELDDDRSFVVDCMGYRRGKDDELKQMTRFTMEKAKHSGPQEMGPLMAAVIMAALSGPGATSAPAVTPHWLSVPKNFRPQRMLAWV